MQDQNQQEYLTQDKFDEFTKELEHLKKVRRKEVAESLEYAKSLGDLSENAEYQEARDAQAQLEDRISYLETLLRSAEIVSGHTTDVATVGSKVTVKREGGSKEEQFTLVGSEEVDTEAGKVSVVSPIGKGLLNAKKGETVTIHAPKGDIKMTVKNIA